MFLSLLSELFAFITLTPVTFNMLIFESSYVKLLSLIELLVVVYILYPN